MSRAGIVAHGVYVPRGRLPLAMLGGRPAREGGPEKAVAGFDEDSVTMAVAAAGDCLANAPATDTVDALYFASTTAPYAEKQSAAIVARALGLRRDARTADFAGSLRAGTTALAAAFDAVAAGSARAVLVVAADCRLARPGSAAEASFGDAAAAFLIASDGVVAQVAARAAVNDEILDVWRSSGQRFVESWEERFVVEHGYMAVVREAVESLLATAGSTPGDVRRAALYAPDARSHAALARSLGLSAEQLVDPLFARLGNCGTPFALLLLADALETSEAGDRVVVASYGDGADALAFEVVAARERGRAPRDLARHLARRRALPSYETFLRSRGLSATQLDRPASAGISATVHFRERDADLGLVGGRCRGCGTEQFPTPRVCYGCQARDDFEPVRLAERRGRVLSVTHDWFFPTPEPPLTAVMVELDGGARVYLQVADAMAGEVSIDLPVELVFRKIHDTGGKPNYFWKCTPVRE